MNPNLLENHTPELSEMPLRTGHPMDTSGILLSLMTLARRVENLKADEQTQKSLRGVVSPGVLHTLLSALQYRDVKTIIHSKKVALLCIGIAQSIGWTSKQLRQLEVAALLHDLGKIGVPDHILSKPGRLNADEMDLMCLHRKIALDVLQACRIDATVLEIIDQSQVHYNGASDGFRKIGGEMHQGARILSVADAYDSLTSKRSYRDGKNHEDTMKSLREGAGTQFDGNVISALSRWYHENGEEYTAMVNAIDESAFRMSEADVRQIQEATSLGYIFSYLYLLESMYDGFFILDPDLNYIVWSTGLQNLLGYKMDDMLGTKWSPVKLGYADKHGESILEDNNCPINYVSDTKQMASNYLRVESTDEQWIPVEVQTIPLMDTNGQLQGIAEIYRDMSSAKHHAQSYQDLMLAATQDPLTLVANRGQLETFLAKSILQFHEQTDPDPFCVMFIDVDYFKSINDTYDHATGDAVLIDVARLLQHETYSGELVGRYGGEEFVVICPETDLDAGVRRAERLRMVLRSTEVGGIPDLKVTASFGVAEVEPGDSVESIFRRADKGVYLSKENGRDQTTWLTTKQLMNSEEVEDSDLGSSNPELHPFVYEEKFRTFLATNLFACKLEGLVRENNGKLLIVEEDHIKIQFGKVGFLSKWGNTAERKPVEFEIHIYDPSKDRSAMKKAGVKYKVELRISIKPLGKPSTVENFQTRAAGIMKTFKSYFAF